MSKLLQDSAFFCLAISLIGYEIGIILRQKTKLALCNPLLISIVFVIIILKVTNIKYEVYEDGSSLLSYLLTPSTVCLAIPLHQQMGLLKKNMKAILAGILSGVFTSLAGVWVCVKHLADADVGVFVVEVAKGYEERVFPAV